MNVFATLAEPVRNRPGVGVSYVRPVAKPKPVKLRLNHIPAVDNPWNLNGRECQVLQSIVECRTAKETAQLLGLALKTIEIHTMALRKKMGARSSVEAALMWDRLHRSEQ